MKQEQLWDIEQLNNISCVNVTHRGKLSIDLVNQDDTQLSSVLFLIVSLGHLQVLTTT